MTDQQRWDTIAAWGFGHMITPAQDRLAAEGVSFTQAYCPGATCVASRAAMFTGMYPHNSGVYSFQEWGAHRNWVQDLADGGYHCVNIGKMHFSPRDIGGGFHERVVVENPTSVNLSKGNIDDDWGRYLTFHGIERPNERHITDPDWAVKLQGVPWQHEERFHSDVFIGNSAINWIRHHTPSKPVFLQVGFTGPHEPWDPLPRHLDLYEGREIPEAVTRPGELDEKPRQQEALKRNFASAQHESGIDMYLANDDRISHMRRHYYAKNTTVDEQVGEVLDALEENGYLEDSLVIFCSDHGDMLGDHSMAYKWLMYDPITHIPLIIRYPKGSRGGQHVDDLVSLMDIGPTILDAAGIQIPRYLEGRSLLGYGDESAVTDVKPREFVVCEDNYQIMMRTKTHKMVYYIGEEDGELYDLVKDPEELWNLWQDGEYREIKVGMQQQLLAWLAASNYWHAGYKRDRSKSYQVRWPSATNCNLQGPPEAHPERPIL
jgi:arylsulfatase A-like enzyme